jgi:hypothetical protein
MDAVARGYLKAMYFGISADAEATNLLEARAQLCNAATVK